MGLRGPKAAPPQQQSRYVSIRLPNQVLTLAELAAKKEGITRQAWMSGAVVEKLQQELKDSS